MAGVASTHILLAFCLLFFAAAAHAAAGPNADADVLLKFKSGIIDNAGALRSWSAGTSPCTGDASSWAGVICHNGNVLGLQLENIGLSGTLDLHPLESLRRLRTLSFMNNNFDGSMPEVKEMSGLRSIYLSMNKFSGKIPEDAFTGMGSLKKVFLSRNDFSGPIPKSLATVPRLLELLLDGNKFDGEIPDLQQKDLKVLNVSNNDLEGKIPAGLVSIKADMFAGNNKLCGAPLDVKCNSAPSSPSPSPSPSPPTPPITAAASTSPNSTPVLAEKSSGSMAVGVVVALVSTLVIVGVAFMALQRRRESNEHFGPTVSMRHSMRKVGVSMKEEKLEHGRGGDYSNGGGSTLRKAAEQGRLTFVREERGRFFELQDLLKSTAEVLGNANLGCCYRATLLNGPSMVVKRFKEMNRVGREDFEEHMRRLGRLAHPNLLPLVAYYYRKEEKLLITDYVPNKSLAHLLHGDGCGSKKAVLHWGARLKIVKGVANALSYLYDELSMLTVPHGHLKSSNILLNECFEPLLTDYALVPVMNQSHAAQLMVAFKSPERKQFGRSSKKSDVWCLGLLILEILTGKPPSYDQQGKGPGPGHDLVGIGSSTPEEEWLASVVDCDLKEEDQEDDKEEMLKLMKIGLACCEGNVEKRWELKDAVENIEELKGRDHMNDGRSFYSSVSEGGTANDHEDFANVAING